MALVIMREKSMMGNGIFSILMGYYSSLRTLLGYYTGPFPQDMRTSFASLDFILVLVAKLRGKKVLNQSQVCWRTFKNVNTIYNYRQPLDCSLCTVYVFNKTRTKLQLKSLYHEMN